MPDTTREEVSKIDIECSKCGHQGGFISYSAIGRAVQIMSLEKLAELGRKWVDARNGFADAEFEEYKAYKAELEEYEKGKEP